MNEALAQLVAWTLAHRGSRGAVSWRPERFAPEAESGLVVYAHLWLAGDGTHEAQEFRYQELVSHDAISSVRSLETLLGVVAARAAERVILAAEAWLAARQASALGGRTPTRSGGQP